MVSVANAGFRVVWPRYLCDSELVRAVTERHLATGDDTEGLPDRRAKSDVLSRAKLAAGGRTVNAGLPSREPPFVRHGDDLSKFQ